MTLSDLLPKFQGHDIIQRQITRKQYKIKLLSQWRTNRSHTWSVEPRSFQWPWTTGPKPRFQGQAILWGWISPK